MTDANIKALRLLSLFQGSCKSLLQPRHNLINANIRALLDLGMVRYDNRKAVGFAITDAGKIYL